MIGAQQVLDAATDLPRRGTKARSEHADLGIVGSEHVGEYRDEREADENENWNQRKILQLDEVEARRQAGGF